jgi:hypothetical protein
MSNEQFSIPDSRLKEVLFTWLIIYDKGLSRKEISELSATFQDRLYDLLKEYFGDPSVPLNFELTLNPANLQVQRLSASLPLWYKIREGVVTPVGNVPIPPPKEGVYSVIDEAILLPLNAGEFADESGLRGEG